MTDQPIDSPEIVTTTTATASPTDPNPEVRNAYFAQQATDVIALGERCGLHFAIDRALRLQWYAGMQAGIDALATNQRLAREEAEASRG